MDRLLRPERFSIAINTAGCEKAYKHWKRTFTNYIEIVLDSTDASTTKTADGSKAADKSKQKLYALTNSVSSEVYEYFADTTSYEDAISVLDSLYTKPENIIYNRHKLLTTTQTHDQSVDLFINELEKKARDCDFKAVSAEKNRKDYIRDAFISGIKSQTIRVRLLEKSDLELEAAYTLARSLELAQSQSLAYGNTDSLNCVNSPMQKALNNTNTNNEFIPTSPVNPDYGNGGWEVAAMRRSKPAFSNQTFSNQSCYFCGKQRHPRNKCPALNSDCGKCKKRGHWSIVCKSVPSSNVRNNLSNINHPNHIPDMNIYNSYEPMGTIPPEYEDQAHYYEDQANYYDDYENYSNSNIYDQNQVLAAIPYVNNTKVPFCSSS